jgi:hypothetical protein
MAVSWWDAGNRDTTPEYHPLGIPNELYFLGRDAGVPNYWRATRIPRQHQKKDAAPRHVGSGVSLGPARSDVLVVTPLPDGWRSPIASSTSHWNEQMVGADRLW